MDRGRLAYISAYFCFLEPFLQSTQWKGVLWDC